MEIKRDSYLNALIRKKGNGLIKIITGIRRCGKSYLLRTLFKNYLLKTGVPDNHIIEMSFDLYENRKYQDSQIFFEWVNQKLDNQGIYYVLLDEVQLLQNFEAILNSLNEKKNVDVYVTGSNARFLSKDIVTEFAGRGDEIPMYPLSFAEFMSVYPGDSFHGFQDYLTYGGIPMVVLSDDRDKAALLDSLFKETYLRDIILHNKVKKANEIEDLLNILSSDIGSFTNVLKLKNTFRSVKQSTLSLATIAKYLSYCEDSFLVSSAYRYDIKGKAYLKTSKKYYFTDLGLRNARLGFRQNEPTHALENVLYNELRSRGYHVDVGIVPVAERDSNGKLSHKQLEIDFVCRDGQKQYYVQSCYSLPDEEKRKQEIRPFLKADNSFKKILVTNDLVPLSYDDNGIMTVNALDFLLDKNSLNR